MSSENTPPPPPPTLLPPISMFTQSTSILPASPPQNYETHHHKNQLPILPKPRQQEFFHSEVPDQSSLWALFHKFQQQQQQQQQQDTHHEQPNGTTTATATTTTTSSSSSSSSAFTNNRRASDPVSSTSNHQQQQQPLSSEEVLAEKRRRNAGASARFRDRRKQRERDLQEKCDSLLQRAKELELALKRIDPEHPLISNSGSTINNNSSNKSTDDLSSPSPNNDLGDRVGQLEHLMTRFRQEKETDTQKLLELEKENKYLKSLLVPVSLPRNSNINGRKRSRSPSTQDSKRRQHHHYYSCSSASSTSSSEENEERRQ